MIKMEGNRPPEIEIFRAAENLARFSDMHAQMQESRERHPFSTETAPTEAGLFEINDDSTKAMGKLVVRTYAELVAADQKFVADQIINTRAELARITKQEVAIPQD